MGIYATERNRVLAKMCNDVLQYLVQARERDLVKCHFFVSNFTAKFLKVEFPPDNMLIDYFGDSSISKLKSTLLKLWNGF